MKRKVFLIPLMGFILALVVLFMPAGKITFDQSVSANRLLIQYEVGCGNAFVRVLNGGEAVVAPYKSAYPQIGTDEIVFASGSDEPRLHYASADFMSSGLGGRYTYIVEGEVVGVVPGAQDCCASHNDYVAEFAVSDWYYTKYVPYVCVGNFGLIMLCLFLGALALGWLVIGPVALRIMRKLGY